MLTAFLLTALGCSNESQPANQPSPPIRQQEATDRPQYESPVAGVFQKKPEATPDIAANNPTVIAATDGNPTSSGTASATTIVNKRLPDDRPSLNPKRLQANGISRYDGRRLILLSDLPADKVAHLPALADQLFATLEAHFGALPPALDGSEFQVTGHLMADEKRFQTAGLMPPAGYTFRQGRHLNYQFWMIDQTDDYYRRHLLFHEFVHCFMTCESGMQGIPPLWYIEGMAEYFATHRLVLDDHSTARAEFGILPNRFEGFEGWGRISEIKRQFAQESDSPSSVLSIPPLPDVMPDTVAVFKEDDQYAASWALCWLLQTHPKYKAAFEPLKNLRRRDEFIHGSTAIRDEVEDQLSIDWLLTAEDLEEGFDPELSFPVHGVVHLDPASPNSGDAHEFNLQANRGWQDTGLRVAGGDSVRITCGGRFSVNDTPKPWISEPQGVSIEYHRGHPLGMVVGIWVSADGMRISRRVPIGGSADVTAPFDGSLWVQVNDSSSSRDNNDGIVEVLLNRAPSKRLQP